MPLFETSAKDDDKCDHVEAIFLTLAHKINANKTLFKTGNPGGGEDTVKVGEKSENESDDDGGSCCF